MKRAFYDNVQTIEAAVTQVLKNSTKTEFKKSMDKLVDRSKRCIELNRSYYIIYILLSFINYPIIF